ncbi:MAG: N-glycosylase/DNA lyase [Candidatus Thermoplasmatota archaeon]
MHLQGLHEDAVDEVKRIYMEHRDEVLSRSERFREIWAGGSEEDIFLELVFCLLTPQSRARACWAAVEGLRNSGMLWNGGAEDISSELCSVRFRHTKARRIVAARERFTKDGRLCMRGQISRHPNAYEAREWLVRSVDGLGYKEASHFLRNIGLGEDLAILDRHVLGRLRALGVIDEIPHSLHRRKYMEIEARMKMLAERINIEMGHLDLVLWCMKTREIFK